ncbi:LytTR family DNA-binding domain-containing protein [Paenibacillus ferrarius]|uniref:LytTR family DNA-binding domain-containing protein n=1 Tax=Paenibacillus ferrarius TaxID=1469647 RepID=UPI003D26D631
MKISIEQIDQTQEEEILIRCHVINDEVRSLKEKLKAESIVLLGYHYDRVHRIKLNDIYYFEAVDGKVFLYAKDNVYEVKHKLYELEEMCKEKKCFRASKSTIINIAKISHVSPSFSGRFEATLINGERIMISRQYVPALKSSLGL